MRTISMVCLIVVSLIQAASAERQLNNAQRAVLNNIILAQVIAHNCQQLRVNNMVVLQKISETSLEITDVGVYTTWDNSKEAANIEVHGWGTTKQRCQKGRLLFGPSGTTIPGLLLDR